MPKKEVLVVLTDRWADWEPSFAIPEINSSPEYTVKTIAEDFQPKSSIGGLSVTIDYCTDEYIHFDQCAMVILPGGFAWKDAPHEKIVSLVQRAIDANIPIAAICGATLFLARNGFLDQVNHSGDEEKYFQEEPGYHGQAHFQPKQVVVDQGIITANETAALEFAYEILKILKIDSDKEINHWYASFKSGLFH